MQITGVYIKDFGNHRETTIDLTHALSIFRGPLESGKTMIRDAIRWAFTGVCRGMEKRKDEPNLIRHGAKGAEVQVPFTHNGEDYKITRGVSASTQSLILHKAGNVVATGLKDAQAAIYATLGVSEALLANLFDAFELSQMASRDRKKIIQGLFTSDSPDILKKYLVDAGHGGLEQAKPEGGSISHLDAILGAYSTQGIDAASGYAVDQRILAKRELKALIDPEEPEGAGIPQSEIDAAQAELKTVQANRDELAGAVMNAATKAAKPDQRPATKVKIDALEKEIKPSAELERAVDKARTALSAAITSDAGAPLADGSSPLLVAHMNALSVLMASDGEASKKTIAWLEGQIAMLEADQPKQKESTEYKPIAPAAKADYDAAVKTQADNKVLEERLVTLQQSIEKESTEMKVTLKASWGWSLDKVQQEVSELDTQLEALRKKCSVSGLVADYERRKAETVKKRGQLHAKVENWESVCKALDPKSEALTALFSSGKEVFAAAFEKATTALGMTISLAEDYSFRAPGFGQINSIGYLSKSRRYRVGAALLIAVCAQIGFDTVILDEGDILWGEAKMDMTKLLRSAQGMGLNAMLFTTGKPEPESISESTHIYAVDNGVVS